MPYLRLLCLVLLFSPVVAAQAPTGSGGVNAPRHQDAPYVVLISIDGFRWDYVDRREARSLKSIAEQGVRGERLLPVFPTLTFPNHYSIATGLYPSRHGIVANDFPLSDGSWYRLRSRQKVQDGRNYGGTPIWVAAETQGMVSASFFWVGSEADIQGIHPTHYRLYDKKIRPGQRTKQVLAWLKAPRPQRPHFITLYFEQVDDYSHWYGPGADETGRTIRDISRQLGRLWRGIQRLPHGDQVNMIFVSDHGQARFAEPYQPFSLEGLVDLEDVVAVNGDSYLFLHFERPDPGRARHIRDVVNEHWQHGEAWLPEDAPQAWQLTENSRLPDVILVADVGGMAGRIGFFDAVITGIEIGETVVAAAIGRGRG